MREDIERTETEIIYVNGMNPIRSEYPLAVGYHYRYRIHRPGGWGPWMPSEEAYLSKEKAEAAMRVAELAMGIAGLVDEED